jgi:hypothetical protein
MDEEEVRARAHAIWEAEGRPEGRALEHWYLAKEQVTAHKTLGRGEYEAWQRGPTVTTRATGTLPGPGFEAFLEPHRIEPNDPESGNAFLGYMLVFRQVRPGSNREPTPFLVERQFEYRGSVFEVLVFDKHGEHRLYPNEK